MKAAAIILAGGKSSRMGQNKALLPINGLSNIERIKNVLAEVFQDIIIVANDEELYQFLDIPIVKDKLKNCGPLAGIHAGLLASKHETNLFIACDMPFISSEIAKQLLAQSTGVDAVVPIINGKQQPLFAVYKKSVLPTLESCITTNHLRIKDVIDRLNVNFLTEKQLLNKEIANLEQVFYNMNHPSEYEKAIKIAQK